MRCLLALTALCAPNLGARAAEPKPEAADAVMADAMKAFSTPGAALVVVRGDKTLVLKGYGVRAHGENGPVTPDTVFPLASCTKQFTTALLAMLVDDDKLTWDDPVKKHFPEFKLSDPNASAMLTVRDLLTMRTGLGKNDLLWYRAPWSLDHALKQAEHLPLEYPFRSGYRYSSIPFIAAGRIAEKCGKSKWEKMMREMLTDPLEMKGVTFTTAEIPETAERARGHRLDKAGKVEPMPAYEIKEPNPSASMNATPRDLAAWLQFQLSDGVAPNGKRLVSSTPLLETRTPHNPIRLGAAARAAFPDTVQTTYAMGWVVSDYRGLKVVAHGGVIDGFRLQITLLPDQDLGFAVLTNVHESRLPQSATNSLIDLYGGFKPKDWNALFRKLDDEEAEAQKAALAVRDKARDPRTKPSLALASYEGKYTHPAFGTATVAQTDEKLTVKWSSFTCPLEHFERDRFRITKGYFEDDLLPFAVRDGKATGLTLAGIAFKR